MKITLSLGLCFIFFRVLFCCVKGSKWRLTITCIVSFFFFCDLNEVLNLVKIKPKPKFPDIQYDVSSLIQDETL